MVTVYVERQDICFDYSEEFKKRKKLLDQANHLYLTICQTPKQQDFSTLADIRSILDPGLSSTDIVDLDFFEEKIMQYAKEQNIDLSTITSKIDKPVTINLPNRKVINAANYELQAALDVSTELKSNTIVWIPLGISIVIPYNVEFQIRSDNKWIKHGVTILNGIYTINSDNCKNITLPFINFGNTPVEINRGDVIAQGVFSSIISPVMLDMADNTNLKKTG